MAAVVMAGAVGRGEEEWEAIVLSRGEARLKEGGMGADSKGERGAAEWAGAKVGKTAAASVGEGEGEGAVVAVRVGARTGVGSGVGGVDQGERHVVLLPLGSRSTPALIPAKAGIQNLWR